MQALESYQWPGNVRELENALEYALAVGTGAELTPADLPPEVVSGHACAGDIIERCLRNDSSLAEVERQYILSVFERCGRHHISTASVLGIDRRTLYRKLQQYGLGTPAEERVSNIFS